MKGHGRIGTGVENTKSDIDQRSVPTRKREGGREGNEQLRHPSNDAVGSETEDSKDDGSEDDSRSS